MSVSGKAIAVCTLLSFSPLCFADFYLGAAGTAAGYKYDDVSRGFGVQGFGGYHLESIPLMFEVGYLDTGKSKIDSFSEDGITGTNLSLAFKGALISVGYFGKFDHNGSGGFAKLGYYTGKSKGTGVFNGIDFNNEETSNGAMFSLGIDWMFTRHVGLHADVGSLLNVKDLPQFSSDHTSNVTIASLGLVFSFGGSEPQYRRTPTRTASVVAPYQAPTATQPAAFAINAQANPGTVVRGQPSANGSVTMVLQNGGTVGVGSRIENADGAWCFVSAGEARGWVRESDLQASVSP